MTISNTAGITALSLALVAGTAMGCPLHKQMFSDWDADKDRQLTQAEFDAGMGASADFAGLDTDASGSLSEEEFSAYVGAEGG